MRALVVAGGCWGERVGRGRGTAKAVLVRRLRTVLGLCREEEAARSMRSGPCVGELPRLVLLSHHPRKMYGDGHLQLHREASFVSNIRTTSFAIRYCFFECTHSISTSAMQFWASYRSGSSPERL